MSHPFERPHRPTLDGAGGSAMRSAERGPGRPSTQVLGHDDPFVEWRRRMVEHQLKAEGITDPLVLKAMEKIPRHLFVPEVLRDVAYVDCALPIGEGQTISQPYMVAFMTQTLRLGGGERVLEIGTGSGYQAAILAMLAREVYTVERIEPLAEKARALLEDLGFDNVHVLVGNGSLGLPGEAPFDRILVTAGVPSIPPALIDQLAIGGILVAPVGDLSSQEIATVVKEERGLKVERGIRCIFVPLIGLGGWHLGAATQRGG